MTATRSGAESDGERRAVEVRARTVDEAVARGLVRLGGLSRSEVEIEVLSEGRTGLLGFGSEEAAVRVTALRPGEARREETTAEPEKPARKRERDGDKRRRRKQSDASDGEDAATKEPRDEPSRPKAKRGRGRKRAERGGAEAAAETREDKPSGGGRMPVAETEEAFAEAEDAARAFLTGVLVQLGCEEPRVERVESLLPIEVEEDQSLVLGIRGGGAERLLKDDNAPLLALQFLARLVTSRQTGHWVNLLLDVDGDRARRIKELVHMAEQSAELVEREGRPVSLPPMSAYERRVVHLALREHPTVATQSIGSGERRKVTVRLQGQLLPNV